jgi:hypothetical protein
VDLLRAGGGGAGAQVGARPGGGTCWRGTPTCRRFVETASKGLEALAKLIEVVSAKIDPAAIDASARRSTCSSGAGAVAATSLDLAVGLARASTARRRAGVADQLCRDDRKAWTPWPS